MPDPITGAPEGEPTTAAPDTDRGFPQGTPIAEMTDAQRAAYWQHYARKHEDAVKSFGGLTPQQVAEQQAELETLRTEKLTADEKAMKAARDEAAKAAAEAAKAEFEPRLRAAELKAIASEVIKGDQLTAFMSIANPGAFVGENGEIDEAQVTAALTGMFGAQQPNPTPGQRWQNAGQFAPPPPPGRPGAGGQAEAAKRFGTQPNPQ